MKFMPVTPSKDGSEPMKMVKDYKTTSTHT